MYIYIHLYITYRLVDAQCLYLVCEQVEDEALRYMDIYT